MQLKKVFVYLPIRSFGDFIISATVLKRHSRAKIPVYLSNYLIDLYNAIDGNSIFDVLSYLDFNNQPAYFEIHKVRDEKNIKRLLTDSKKTLLLNPNNNYLLDYRSRRLFFFNKKLIWPEVNQNIYEAKYALFSSHFSLDKNDFYKQSFLKIKPKRVVIFPESRVKEKEINIKLLSEIVLTFVNTAIVIARFSTKPSDQSSNSTTVYYSNFNELINLINQNDLIISAESLPYHLAYFYNKPHFVIYKNTKHFKATFMTDFMISNNYYSTFDGTNASTVIDKLSLILN